MVELFERAEQALLGQQALEEAFVDERELAEEPDQVVEVDVVDLALAGHARAQQLDHRVVDVRAVEEAEVLHDVEDSFIIEVRDGQGLEQAVRGAPVQVVEHGQEVGEGPAALGRLGHDQQHPDLVGVGEVLERVVAAPEVLEVAAGRRDGRRVDDVARRVVVAPGPQGRALVDQEDVLEPRLEHARAVRHDLEARDRLAEEQLREEHVEPEVVEAAAEVLVLAERLEDQEVVVVVGVGVDDEHGLAEDHPGEPDDHAPLGQVQQLPAVPQEVQRELHQAEEQVGHVRDRAV